MRVTGEGCTVPFAAQDVLGRAGTENFPVAPRILPPRYREPLLAVYGFARLVDEVGDEAAGDRAALLDEIERDLDRAFIGRAKHPLLQRLARACDNRPLPRSAFARLIEANRRDQVVHRYHTWAELSEYCSLSANPVGELVLHVFRAATPKRIRLSDAVCTALQLIEHCQDVVEDLERGRVYLPAEDLKRFGCEPQDLSKRPTPPEVRHLLEFETQRARSLLAAGTPILATLHGWARLSVAGFVAGGYAAIDGLRRADFRVHAGAPGRRKVDFGRRLFRVLFSRPGRTCT